MKRFLCFVFLVALLAAGALLVLSRSEPEPEYEGRLITSWIADLASSEYEIHNKAAGTVEAVGTEAVPFLVRALQRKETALMRAWASAAGRFPLLRLQRVDPSLLREKAAEQLGLVRGQSGVVVPVLIAALQDDHSNVSSEVQRALRRIGPVSLLPLVQALRHPDARIRQRSAEVIGDFGYAAKSAVPALSGALKDPNEGVRTSAARALGATSGGDETAIAALILGLGDPAVAVRTAASGSLGLLGPFAKASVPALCRGLNDPDAGARVAAAKALWLVDGQTDRVVPVLTDALKDPRVGWQASFVLGEIGPAASGAATALIAALKQERVPSALRAPPSSAIALGRIGRTAVPGLIRTLQDEQSSVRTSAAIALGMMGAQAEQAIPQLVKLLNDPDREVRQASVLSLGAIGPLTKELVPALVRMMRDEDIFIRSMASAALQRIDPAAAADAGTVTE